MSAVMSVRKKFKDSFTDRHGVKLGFMSFFVRAAVEALRLVPEINGRIEGEEIVMPSYQDVGIAVGHDAAFVQQQQAREALASELEAERARKMAKLQADIEQERLKARVTWERQQADTMHRIEEAALGQGARFAARLLEQTAGPELQDRLVEDDVDEYYRYRAKE